MSVYLHLAVSIKGIRMRQSTNLVFYRIGFLILQQLLSNGCNDIWCQNISFMSDNPVCKCYQDAILAYEN